MRYSTLFILSPSFLALALRLEFEGRSLASLKSVNNNVLAATGSDHFDEVVSVFILSLALDLPVLTLTVKPARPVMCSTSPMLQLKVLRIPSKWIQGVPTCGSTWARINPPMWYVISSQKEQFRLILAYLQTSTSYNLTYGTGYAYGPIARGPVSFAECGRFHPPNVTC